MLPLQEVSTSVDALDEQAQSLIQRVGDRVRQVRKRKRLSRRQLSEMSGVSQRYLAQLETGDGNISIGLLKRLALTLEQPIEALVSDPEPGADELAELINLYRSADSRARAGILDVLNPARVRAQKSQRLCLVGLRGAGKSTLGRALSDKLDVPFVELNEHIERRAGAPVPEIMALYGQEGYRQLESDSLDELIASAERMIVAVAGGVVSEKDTFARVLSRFHTVWIKASPGEHMERVAAQGDRRPMEGNPQAMAQLRQLLKSRETRYSQAEYQLDTSGKYLSQSLTELLELVSVNELLEKSESQ
ncbi:MAG: helix-turn-helix transcriptional regulator [Granulosicoccus sp.]